MSAIYTIIILALFALGMPVAFVLMLGGVLGMLLFLGGTAAFRESPVISYWSVDDCGVVGVGGGGVLGGRPLVVLRREHGLG